MSTPPLPVAGVSVIIPVLDRLAFTRQCLDRLGRHLPVARAVEVVIIDNGSTDDTARFFAAPPAYPFALRYERNEANLGFARANNQGAACSSHPWLVFLNNDTIVRPRWLDEMLRVAADETVGIVGIRQLFPYTNRIHHTGIVFDQGALPQHLYPHADASLPSTAKERDYQAVNGACLLISRALFDACGGFDEGYVNGYEDIDLCLKVQARRCRVVCCTSASIYHYGQISQGRTARDDRNAARFLERWKAHVRIDAPDYRAADRRDQPADPTRRAPAVLSLDDHYYFADDLAKPSALSWVVAELARALSAEGVPVRLRQASLPGNADDGTRAALAPLMLPAAPVGGVQIKWSHYWAHHLGLELEGDVNLELFVINYLFSRPFAEPWDYWLQSLAHNHTHKLALSEYSRQALRQCGVDDQAIHVLHPGYAREVEQVRRSRHTDSTFRFLTVTNSHDPNRYGTTALLDAYWTAFGPADDVELIVRDYGVGAADRSIRQAIAGAKGRARVDYRPEFTTKRALIDLYASCDAFVSSHRGEGFGMKILDAMAVGLPVILPLYGGPTDYCRPGNCYPVDFNEVPLGDCLDRQSLKITNGPTWCEADAADLARRLRHVATHPAEARDIGARARQDVIDAFTWQRSARRLIEIVEDVRRRSAARVSPRRQPEVASPAPAHASPYWQGLRVSAVIPTFNRLDKLKRCLEALEDQSVLHDEYEVIVVDDGSSDGTVEWLRQYAPPFRLVVVAQANQGPGAARNAGVTQALGEFVLFLGDDIYPGRRLLEEHLLAHAEAPGDHVAILGHIDWPADVTPNAVMRYVCGRGSLQFGYEYIPKLPALDFRFFYTSNVSVAREFLVQAARAGVIFDRAFRYAAYEDSELAWRLEKRGLQIVYHAAAHVEHDHWMDLQSFCRREFKVGQMAVVFYRKHPSADAIVDVRWIADFMDTVAGLAGNPDVLVRLEAFDRDSEAFLVSAERMLESLLGLRGSSGGPTAASDRLERQHHTILAHLFDVHRTRGKIKEWYSGVSNQQTVDAAMTVLACLRRVEFLGRGLGDLEQIGGSPQWCDAASTSDLKHRVKQLEQDLAAHLGHGGGPTTLIGRLVTHPRLVDGLGPVLYAMDGRVRAALVSRGWTRTLDRYLRLRRQLRRLRR
jgi:GT2 family glycosyltransferase/glycosyltransferase involved in cell wall biosynthesis